MITNVILQPNVLGQHNINCLDNDAVVVIKHLIQQMLVREPKLCMVCQTSAIIDALVVNASRASAVLIALATATDRRTLFARYPSAIVHSKGEVSTNPIHYVKAR